MNLTELANKFGTDKGTTYGHRHGFTEVYEKYLQPLRGKDITLLEIGVMRGSSLVMWKEYFPNLFLIGYDRNPVCAQLEDPSQNVFIFTGDQGNVQHLEACMSRFNRKLDIVVDDGSHIDSLTMTSFNVFWKHLAPGGLYFIEDLEPGYNAIIDYFEKNKFLYDAAVYMPDAPNVNPYHLRILAIKK